MIIQMSCPSILSSDPTSYRIQGEASLRDTPNGLMITSRGQATVECDVVLVDGLEYRFLLTALSSEKAKVNLVFYAVSPVPYISFYTPYQLPDVIMPTLYTFKASSQINRLVIQITGDPFVETNLTEVCFQPIVTLLGENCLVETPEGGKRVGDLVPGSLLTALEGARHLNNIVEKDALPEFLSPLNSVICSSSTEKLYCLFLDSWGCVRVGDRVVSLPEANLIV